MNLTAETEKDSSSRVGNDYQRPTDNAQEEKSFKKNNSINTIIPQNESSRQYNPKDKDVFKLIRDDFSLVDYIKIQYPDSNISNHGNYCEIEPCAICGGSGHFRVNFSNDAELFKTFGANCLDNAKNKSKIPNGGGDIWTFVMHVEGYTKSEAIERITSMKPITTERRQKRTATKTAAVLTDISTFTNSLEHTDYFTVERGISEELVKHYGLGCIGESTNLDAFDKKTQYVLKQYYRYIMPVTNTFAFARRMESAMMEPQKYSKTMNLGSIVPANLHYLEESTPSQIFITEGFIDALSLETIGHKAIALHGVSYGKLMEEIRSNIDNLKTTVFYLAADNDEAGRKLNMSLSQELTKLGLKFAIMSFPYGIKDVNEFLCEDKNAFKMFVYDFVETAIKELEEKEHNNVDYSFLLNEKGSIKEIELYKHTIANNEFLTDGDRLFAYQRDKGIWVIDGARIIKKFISNTQLKLNKISPSQTERIVQTIKNTNSISKNILNHSLNSRPYKVTFKNGTYDILNGTFVESFFLEDRSTISIPHNYSEEKQISGDILPIKTYEYLSTVLDKEEIDFLFKYIGFCFIKKYTTEASMILYGSGKNGKSVIIKIVNEIFGRNNIANVPLNQLDKDFSLAQLDGKILNTVAEIDADYVEKSATFKSLTSGEGVSVSNKFETPYTMYSFAKFLFSANKLPQFKDNTPGMQRRWLVIPFTKMLEEKDRKSPDFILNDEDEIERIIIHALNSIRKILSKDGETHFTETEKMLLAKQEWFNSNNHINLFVDEKVSLNAPTKTKHTDAYTSYKDWCLDSGYKPMKKINFYSEFLTETKTTETKEGNSRYWNIYIRS